MAKMFDGKVFRYDNSYTTKARAEREAKALRRNQWNARIVWTKALYGGQWAIYRRRRK